MVDLLKAFGRGILYVLAFPFFLIVLAVFAVIGFIAFIFQLIKSVIFFFTGQKFFPELPEDKELRLMKEAEEAKNNPTQEAAPQPQVAPKQANNTMIFEEINDEPVFEKEPNPIISPIPTPTPTSVEEACFQDLSVKEETKKEEPIVEPVKQEEIPIELVKEEPIVEEQPSTLEDLIKEDEKEDDALDNFLSALEEEKNEPEEVLETYNPRGSEDSFQDDDNDDTHMGVDINYDDWGKR